MDKGKRIIGAAFWSLCLAVLILDTKTAVSAAKDAIDLCMTVLIPSIFAFLVICPMVSGQIGSFFGMFRPLARLLRLPQGAEDIFLLGLLGGYPIGATVICNSVHMGRLDKQDAERMLAFCNNAGPSFLFGIGTLLFPHIGYCAGIWLIHIASAVIVAILTPGRGGQAGRAVTSSPSLQATLRKALVTMSGICGWVVLFRIVIAFTQRWFLWIFPPEAQLLLRGALELASGAVGLGQVSMLGQRLLYFSMLLSFGGSCVYMQTASVCSGLSIKYYLPGKTAQCAVSVLMATAVQFLLPASQRYYPHPFLLILCAAICVIYPFILQKIEKSSRNPAAVGV